MLEPLEPRRLYTAVSFANNTLVVEEGDDVAGQAVTVRFDGATLSVDTQERPDGSVVTRTFPVAGDFRVLVDGGGGDDRIDLSGVPAPATVFGNGGDDTIIGGSQADSLSGGDGNDLIQGAAGNDTVNGDAGNDTLRGGNGDDLQLGGDGDDLLDAGTSQYNGADTLGGGGGDDTADYSKRLENLNVSLDGVANDGGNDQFLILSPDATTVTVGSVPPLITAPRGTPGAAATEGDDVMPDVEAILGGAGNDSLAGAPNDFYPFDAALRPSVFSPGGQVDLEGGAGNDTLYAQGSAPNTLRGAGGDDVLVNAYIGGNLIAGGAGDDTVDYSHLNQAFDLRITLDGQPGDAYALGYQNVVIADTVGGDVENATGGPGNDTIAGNAGDNVLVGNGGNDFIFGHGGNDTLRGFLGNDTLFGGPGADSLAGGGGDDELHAQDGAAADTVDGGSGTNVAFADSRDGHADVLTNVQSSELSVDALPPGDLPVGPVQHGPVTAE